MKRKLLVTFLTFLTLILVACSKDDNVIRVGMDLRYPPFETVTLENKPRGISVDIAYELGKFLGKKVEIVNTEFSGLILALQSGDVDIIIGSMSITEEREKVVSFTKPYFYFKIISLLNKEFAERNNLTEESTVQELLQVESARYIGIAGQVSASIPKSYNKDVIDATDVGTAVASIAQGTSDVLLMSANPVVSGYNANPDKTMIFWDPFESSPIGMAIKKGNTDLLNKANLFIDTFNDEGGMYDMLKETWDQIILDELGKFGLSFYIDE